VLLTPTLAMPPVVTGTLQPERAEVLVMKLLGRLNAGGLIRALAGIETLADKVFEFMPYTPSVLPVILVVYVTKVIDNEALL